jgi:hypothetical protein
MNTQFGGRERPHLVIKDWIRLGESGTGALPAPDTPPLAQPDSASPTAASSAQSVAPLTTKEVVNDKIVF